MKVRRIEHIGVAVRSASASAEILRRVLGLETAYEEQDERFKIAMLPIGESNLELIESKVAGTGLARWLTEKGEGLWHICFEVDDIDEALRELAQRGVKVLDEQPRTGHAGARIAFIDPSETAGMLVELAELLPARAPRTLEPHIDWEGRDVADPAAFTLQLTDKDRAELDLALRHAASTRKALPELELGDFPLDAFATKLAVVERELLDGRGFVRIAGLDRGAYADDDLTRIFWGIGQHLGRAMPLNKSGEVLVDVTDQGVTLDDDEFLAYKVGQSALEFHTDGADIIGLLSLHPAKSGGLSRIGNAVAIHNAMVERRPDLAAALYEDLPWDYRGAQPPGGPRWFHRSVFTEHANRLFVRIVPFFIKNAQRFDEAPRLSTKAIEALALFTELAEDPKHHTTMELRPGDMQFIFNYHVVHGRTEYEDDAANGVKRHLKRLWLMAHRIDRPAGFDRRTHAHWSKARSDAT